VTIEVSSPAFEAGATIPKKHTGEGQDVSPPLNWSSLPQVELTSPGNQGDSDHLR
jgi:phosphatidylethanolamine-binding protein (PEBP) family uncharacterized protein